MLRDELPSAHLHFHYTALAQPSFGQRIPLGLHAQLEEMTFQVTHKITHFHPLFADEWVYALFEEDDLVKLLADRC